MNDGSMSIDAAARRDQLAYVDRNEKHAIRARSHHVKRTPWRKARQARARERAA